MSTNARAALVRARTAHRGPRTPRRGRRTALRTALCAALSAALLAGCGITSSFTGTEESQEGRTVTDARGRTVQIPVAPRRVVTLSEPTLDAALAVGVTPVGAAAARGQSSRVASYLPGGVTNTTVVGQLTAPNLELIITLDPDLILTDGTAINDDVLVDKLQGIAPTLWVGPAGNTDWQSGLRSVADALGESAAAEAFVADYALRAQEISDALGPHAGARISIVRWGLASGAFLPESTFPARVLADLGLTRPEAQHVDGNGHSEQVSVENVRLLDGDWMFFCTLGGAAGPATSAEGGGETGVQASADALVKAAELAPGFTELEVYQAGRIVPVDGTAWGSAGGPLAAQRILDDVEAHLLP